MIYCTFALQPKRIRCKFERLSYPKTEKSELSATMGDLLQNAIETSAYWIAFKS